MAPKSEKTILKRKLRPNPRELEQLYTRLELAEQTLRALHEGEVDAVVVSGPGGQQVRTFSGPEYSYRLLVETMAEGALILAPDGTIVYCNGSFAELVRQPVQALIGAGLRSLIRPEDLPAFEAAAEAAKQETRKIEVCLHDGEGFRTPVFLSLSCFAGYGKQDICAVVTDLREQKRNEEIVASGRVARYVLQYALESIAVCDEQGRVLFASENLVKLAGHNLLFHPFDEAVPLFESALPVAGNQAAEKPFSIAGALAGQQIRGVEVILRHHGEVTPFLLSAGPIYGEQDEVLGCVVTLTDLTERKRAEAALRRSERLAATGRLAATIAHEINNPLESVTNLLYLIETSDASKEALRKYARTAQQELARVSHITKQTLAFNRESTTVTEVELADVLESVVALYAQPLQRKGLAVRKDFDFKASIFGFPGELRQVFSNLFANAIEATPAGGTISLRARVATEWNNGRRRGARVVIADSGPGIPQHIRRQIFDPFFSTKGEKGNGLGLWVSKHIVARHGGRLRLRSCVAEGKSGTAVAVFLPEVEPHQLSATADD